MKKEIQQRLVWIKLYEQTKDFGLICRRCGISRSTRLRKVNKLVSRDSVILIMVSTLI